MKKEEFSSNNLLDNNSSGNQLKIAKVIINANNTEAIFNKYISEFYTHNSKGVYKEKYLLLLSNVLSAMYISLDSKIEILYSIFQEIDLAVRIKNIAGKNKFKIWLGIRNKFAHGEFISYNGKDVILYNGKICNIEPLFVEFAKCNKSILTALDKYSAELEGPYFNSMRVRKDM